MTTGHKSFGWKGAFGSFFFYSAWEFHLFFFGRRWVTLLMFVEWWFEVERERCLHFELYQTPSTLLPRLLVPTRQMTRSFSLFTRRSYH